jgi:predicted NUDIX family NTP pyrophosphohydrolase
VDPAFLVSNTFTVKFPSGGEKEYPEVDRAAWFSIDTARAKINPAQIDLISQLATKLEIRS